MWLFTGDEYPFYYPMSTRHARPASGLSAYVPICYQHNMTVTYRHDQPLPAGYYSIYECHRNYTACEYNLYTDLRLYNYMYTKKVRCTITKAVDVRVCFGCFILIYFWRCELSYCPQYRSSPLITNMAHALCAFVTSGCWTSLKSAAH